MMSEQTTRHEPDGNLQDRDLFDEQILFIPVEDLGAFDQRVAACIWNGMRAGQQVTLKASVAVQKNLRFVALALGDPEHMQAMSPLPLPEHSTAHCVGWTDMDEWAPEEPEERGWENSDRGCPDACGCDFWEVPILLCVLILLAIGAALIAQR